MKDNHSLNGMATRIQRLSRPMLLQAVDATLSSLGLADLSGPPEGAEEDPKSQSDADTYRADSSLPTPRFAMYRACSYLYPNNRTPENKSYRRRRRSKGRLVCCPPPPRGAGSR